MRRVDWIRIIPLLLIGAFIGAAIWLPRIYPAAGSPQQAAEPDYGTPQPYTGGSWVAYRVTVDDPRMSPFLDALAHVDRASLGFRALNADITYDLTVNTPDDRPPEASLIGNSGHGNVSIEFRQVGDAWRWSGEALALTGPGRHWMGWDEGYWPEETLISCLGDCAANPNTDRLTLGYSGTSTAPAAPWDFLPPASASRHQTPTLSETVARMEAWLPGEAAP